MSVETLENNLVSESMFFKTNYENCKNRYELKKDALNFIDYLIKKNPQDKERLDLIKERDFYKIAHSMIDKKMITNLNLLSDDALDYIKKTDEDFEELNIAFSIFLYDKISDFYFDEKKNNMTYDNIIWIVRLINVNSKQTCSLLETDFYKNILQKTSLFLEQNSNISTNDYRKKIRELMRENVECSDFIILLKKFVEYWHIELKEAKL